jgi:hypothetical protein
MLSVNVKDGGGLAPPLLTSAVDSGERSASKMSVLYDVTPSRLVDR